MKVDSKQILKLNKEDFITSLAYASLCLGQQDYYLTDFIAKFNNKIMNRAKRVKKKMTIQELDRDLIKFSDIELRAEFLKLAMLEDYLTVAEQKRHKELLKHHGLTQNMVRPRRIQQIEWIDRSKYNPELDDFIDSLSADDLNFLYFYCQQMRKLRELGDKDNGLI